MLLFSGWSKVLYGSLLIFLLSQTGFAQTRKDAVLARIEAKLQALTKDHIFSGVVLLGKGSNIEFNGAYGYADVKNKIPMDVNHKFMIASLSKAFTAASILQLVEAGKLSLDDPIQSFFPDFPEATGGPITVHHLLTHTSGIPDYINDFPILFRIRQKLGWRPDINELIGSFMFRKPLFEPESDYAYSNSGYVLLARIVELETDERFGNYLSQHILGPVGMRHSGTEDFDEVAHAAKAYRRRSSRKKPFKNYNPSLIFGMGGMYSTANDLFNWVCSFEKEKSVLNDSSRKKMFSPSKYGYGYGWIIMGSRGRTVISHGGYLPGWSSYLYHYPEDSLTAIILGNYDDLNPQFWAEWISNVWFHNSDPGTAELVDPVDVRLARFTGRYELLQSEGEGQWSDQAIMTVRMIGKTLQLKDSRGSVSLLQPKGALKWFSKEMGVLSLSEDGDSLVLEIKNENGSWIGSRIPAIQ